MNFMILIYSLIYSSLTEASEDLKLAWNSYPEAGVVLATDAGVFRPSDVSELAEKCILSITRNINLNT
jgi:hypothetical protein